MAGGGDGLCENLKPLKGLTFNDTTWQHNY